MTNFSQMVGLEYRKMLGKKSTVITLVVAILFTVISCVGPLMGNYYVDGEVFESNYEGMKKDRDYARELSGREINGELLLEAVESYSNISTTNYMIDDQAEYETFGRPYSEVRNLIRRVLGVEDIDKFQALTRQELKEFYPLQEAKAQAQIESSSMSLKAKEAAIELNQQIKRPFVFSYTDGYTRFSSQLYLVGVVGCFITAICLSPLFSGEYTLKMDSLILSSKYGKNKIIYAKLFTGLSFSIIFTVGLSLISYIICMGIWGPDGYDAPIQLLLTSSNRPFTMGQMVWLQCILILGGNVLSAAIAMLLSARLKSPFMAIVIMSVITVLPTFINVSQTNLMLYYLWQLIPTNMFSATHVTGFLSLDLFGLIIAPYRFLPVFAIITSIVLLPFIYRGFKNHQV
ncbi:MAG: hypothetical protein ACRCST_17575 [Turicibacter sp.]